MSERAEMVDQYCVFHEALEGVEWVADQLQGGLDNGCAGVLRSLHRTLDGLSDIIEIAQHIANGRTGEQIPDDLRACFIKK